MKYKKELNKDGLREIQHINQRQYFSCCLLTPTLPFVKRKMKPLSHQFSMSQPCPVFGWLALQMGLQRQTQQDTRKNLFKPVFSFLLGFKREKKEPSNTHAYKNTDTVKNDKKKLKNKITVGKCAGHEKCCEGFGGQYTSPTLSF